MSVKKGMNSYKFELKPCPFCGSQGDLYYKGENGRFRAACSNEDCRCELPPWVIFDDDEKVFDKINLAVKYWNERSMKEDLNERK